MLAAMKLTAGDELTLHRWEQAWDHYRHLEVMRSQYLGFFFTVVLGVIAFAGPRLATHSLHPDAALIISAGLVVALQVLAVFLFLMITRLNQVIELYGQQIKRMNRWTSSHGALDLSAFDDPPPAPGWWADHGLLAERLLQVALFAFLLLSFAILIRSVNETPGSATAWACTAAAVLTGALAFAASAARRLAFAAGLSETAG